jgi:soluble lytic murein transglycosylase
MTPIPAPSVTQVQELISHRSFTLGYPMPVPEAHLLAEAVIEERGSIALPMILAVVEIESRYDSKGKSKKKCRGLMQLSMGTAKTMAKRLGMSKFNVFDIKTNVKLGVNYLSALLEENDTIGKALTIYNRGYKGFVAHSKKISGYAYSVIKRSKLIQKMLKNDLTCEK